MEARHEPLALVHSCLERMVEQSVSVRGFERAPREDTSVTVLMSRTGLEAEPEIIAEKGIAVMKSMKNQLRKYRRETFLSFKTGKPPSSYPWKNCRITSSMKMASSDASMARGKLACQPRMSELVRSERGRVHAVIGLRQY